MGNEGGVVNAGAASLTIPPGHFQRQHEVKMQYQWAMQDQGTEEYVDAEGEAQRGDCLFTSFQPSGDPTKMPVAQASDSPTKPSMKVPARPSDSHPFPEIYAGEGEDVDQARSFRHVTDLVNPRLEDTTGSGVAYLTFTLLSMVGSLGTVYEVVWVKSKLSKKLSSKILKVSDALGSHGLRYGTQKAMEAIQACHPTAHTE